MKTFKSFIKEAKITKEFAQKIGDKIGVDWKKIPLEQFRIGMETEQKEHDSDPKTDVIPGHDYEMVGKIAHAHLKEFPDYYTRLSKMEKE